MNILGIIEKQRFYFKSKQTLSYEFRLQALGKLRTSISKYEVDLLDALQADLGKSHEEGYLTEVGIVLKEITFMEKNLKRLMRNKKVKTGIENFPAKSYIAPHPYGNVLIISPWNYPVNLALAPLIGAIASGNTVLIKPSEFSVYTSKLIARIISETFDSEYVKVILGGIKENKELLTHKFNFIFFTGSTQVGRIVMQQASKYLTPVCLELGGKSPVIVDKKVPIDVTAKRIVFGKFLNAGQTCVAPDYLYVHKEVKDELLSKLKYYIDELITCDPLKNNHYGKIINEHHFNRLKSYLNDGDILYGGNVDEQSHKMEPTLLYPTSLNSAVMKDEIFGPILPILEYEDINTVIDHVNDNPSPLALYLFTNDKTIENKVMYECQFGGGCVNDTIVHLASDYLPFGGVGESGIGNYHADSSFKTFSHYKSILRKGTWFDQPMRYTPYTSFKTKLVRLFLK